MADRVEETAKDQSEVCQRTAKDCQRTAKKQPRAAKKQPSLISSGSRGMSLVSSLAVGFGLSVIGYRMSLNSVGEWIADGE